MLHAFPKGEPLARHIHGVPFPRNLVFSPDGTSIIGSGYLGRETVGKKRFVHKWDAATGELLMSTPTEHTDQLEALAVSPDVNTVLTGSWGRHNPQMGLENWNRPLHFRHRGTIEVPGHWRFLKMDRRLSVRGRVGGHEDQQKFWDTATGVQISAPDLKEVLGKRSPNLPNRVITAQIDKDRKYIQVQEVANRSRNVSNC